jgi:hypothetical protein
MSKTVPPLRTRLWELARYMRMELHTASLITDEEYAELAQDHDAVRRLEEWDAIRAAEKSPEDGNSAATAIPQQVIADEILRRIAMRYKHCDANIYPAFPGLTAVEAELTVVEAVLRCAAKEGFWLTNMPR